MAILKRKCKCPQPRDCDHVWQVRLKHKSLRTPANPEGKLRMSLETYAPEEKVHGPGTQRKALLLERRIRAELDAGTFVRPAEEADPYRVGGLTVEEGIALYEKDYVKPNHLRWQNARLWWDARFAEGAFKNGKAPLAGVQFTDIERLINDLKTRGQAANTIRLAAQRLHAFFAWAADEDRALIARNPVKSRKLNLPKRPGSRARAVPEGLIAKIAAHADPWLWDLLTVMLNTGLRQATLLRLQRSHCDLVRREMHLTEDVMKSKRAFVTGLTEEVVAAIERRLAAQTTIEDDPFVFGTPHGHRYRARDEAGDAPLWPAQYLWERAQEKAHLQGCGVILHNFRAEAAARVYGLTKDIRLTRDFLNHHSTAQTESYLAPIIGQHHQVAALLEARGTQKGTHPPQEGDNTEETRVH